MKADDSALPEVIRVGVHTTGTSRMAASQVSDTIAVRPVVPLVAEQHEVSAQFAGHFRPACNVHLPHTR